MSAALWLDQAVGHHVEGDLDKMDALAVTAKIKAYAGVAWTLLVEAHERKAHKALGYASWAEYVEAEFDMSRSRSYQLISQARVVLEISEAVSTMVDISEREARDLAPMIEEAKAAVTAVADALPTDASPEDKTAAVTEALDRLRTSVVDARKPKATQTTKTETTTTTFDPETGEIGCDQPSLSEGAAGSGGDESPVAAPSPAPKVAPPTITCPTCHGSGVVAEVAA